MEVYGSLQDVQGVNELRRFTGVYRVCSGLHESQSCTGVVIVYRGLQEFTGYIEVYRIT